MSYYNAFFIYKNAISLYLAIFIGLSSALNLQSLRKVVNQLNEKRENCSSTNLDQEMGGAYFLSLFYNQHKLTFSNSHLLSLTASLEKKLTFSTTSKNASDDRMRRLLLTFATSSPSIWRLGVVVFGARAKNVEQTQNRLYIVGRDLDGKLDDNQFSLSKDMKRFETASNNHKLASENEISMLNEIYKYLFSQRKVEETFLELWCEQNRKFWVLVVMNKTETFGISG